MLYFTKELMQKIQDYQTAEILKQFIHRRNRSLKHGVTWF